jgi:Orsellinic acid/F9775 biosynthesis cluster protein D
MIGIHALLISYFLSFRRVPGFPPIGERPSLERNTSNTTVPQLPASGVIPRVDEIETMAASDASDGDASYFRVLHAYRVLLCRSCGTCYVRGNYGRHLVEVHRVKGMRKRAVVEGLAGADLAASVAEVVRPSHGQTRVEGLRVHDGWSCDVDSCTTVSTSHDAIRQHCSRVHRLNVKAAGMVSRVKLQTLFREHPQYFIVTVPEVDLRSSPARQRATGVSPPASPSRTPMEAAFTSLCRQLGQARQHRRARHTTVPDPKHVSEVTPWLRRTQFHIYLSGLNPAAFTAAYQLPRAASGEAALALICGSVDRVLRADLQRLGSGTERRLYRVDRQLLNSFQEHVTSQVPLGRPQERSSVPAYTAVFQKAVCFFFRVQTARSSSSGRCSRRRDVNVTPLPP